MKRYRIRLSYDLGVQAKNKQGAVDAVMSKIPDYYFREPEVGMPIYWSIRSNPDSAEIDEVQVWKQSRGR